MQTKQRQPSKSLSATRTPKTAVKGSKAKAKQVKIYLLTCGSKFIMATSKQAEVDAYTENYNKLRHPETPAAIITPTLINLPTWPAE